MSLLQAILLGILQGFTEFLPVSSSGHLVLGQKLLGFENLDQFVMFDLVCHLGTLLAVLIVFSTQILNIIKNQRVVILLIILGTLPLFPLVLVAEPLKRIFNQPEFLGFFFLFTALMLTLATFLGWEKSQGDLRDKNWKDALGIGLFQAVAIFPGISRSGSTIAAARLLGWPVQQAVTFSFLLSIPAILGGVTLEVFKILKYTETTVLPPITIPAYIAGFMTSFIFGLLSLFLLIRLAERNQFVYFVWYLVFLGIGSLIYFNAG